MMGYRFPPETMKELLAKKRILFGKDETKLIELKVYAKDYRVKLASLFELDGRVGTNEIKELFPDSKRPFDFPKTTALIEELLSFTTSSEDLILDSFAGSGTTGHAVMKMNHADRQDRRFILVEMKQSIARNITCERVRRVAEGYKNSKGETCRRTRRRVSLLRVGRAVVRRKREDSRVSELRRPCGAPRLFYRDRRAAPARACDEVSIHRRMPWRWNLHALQRDSRRQKRAGGQCADALGIGEAA